MARLRSVCIAFLVSLLPVAGLAQDGEAHTNYLFTGVIGKDTYILRIVSQKLPKSEGQKQHPERKALDVYSWTVNIDCIERCRCEPHYVRQLENDGRAPWGGGPSSIIQIDDEDAQIMTTWGNGHVYGVTVYGCVDGKITPTLNRSSKSMPSFRLDDDGASLISLSKNEETSSPFVDLHWNGKTFVVRHTRK